jgi:hypothetical protein
MSTKQKYLIGFVVGVILVMVAMLFIPGAKAATFAQASVPEAAAVETTAVPVGYMSGIIADTAANNSQAGKNEKLAKQAKKKFVDTENKLGPLFIKVLAKRSTVLNNLSKSHAKKIKQTPPVYPMSGSKEATVAVSDLAAAQDANRLARRRAWIASSDLAFYKASKKAIDKAFHNQGHASLTSYNDGTRSFGHVARAGRYRGSYIFLPGIGFFIATDVGGAVHGTARADVYTPWAAEPCNNALGVYAAGGPSLYEFNPKALGINMKGFVKAKQKYEQPSAVRRNHKKFGVYK